MEDKNNTEGLERNAQNYVKNIEKSVEKLTTEDPFLKKMCRKMCEKEGRDLFYKKLKNNISGYRNIRKELKDKGIDTSHYDKSISDITSKYNKILQLPID